MRSARLELALHSGALVLPQSGDILVLRPQLGDDLSSLPKVQVVVQTGFKPDYDYFASQGYRMEGEGPFAMAVVCMPRAKAEARMMLAQVRDAAVIVVDGQKTDGIDTILKDCKALGLHVGEALAKAHGKLAVIKPSDALAAWAAGPMMIEGGFQTMPGVFSADAPDQGSMLLAAALPAKLGGRVADMGAGWGYLSRAILGRDGVKTLDLIEADADALACARVNITDPRAQFYWADATTYKGKTQWDTVVMNPPFHAGRSAEPSLGQGFIKAAHRGLAASGSLMLVANRHLPYEKLLVTLFKQVEEVGGDRSFRVLRAALPIRAK